VHVQPALHSARSILSQTGGRNGRFKMSVAGARVGIGANTAVFSVISGVLLCPLPYADPDRVVQVNEILPRSASGVETNGPGWPDDFKEFRSHSRLFAGFITYHVSSGSLFGMGDPEQLSIDSLVHIQEVSTGQIAVVTAALVQTTAITIALPSAASPQI
jgi:putative ABC transport system permease protein